MGSGAPNGGIEIGIGGAGFSPPANLPTPACGGGRTTKWWKGEASEASLCRQRRHYKLMPARAIYNPLNPVNLLNPIPTNDSTQNHNL